jgi:predicted O-methyltransferase YrrM
MEKSPPQEKWIEVEHYIAEQLIPPDEALEAVREANAAAELPAIDVTPAEGKLLHLLARLVGARRILEIGTLGGYSTIWMARALPADGRLITLELEPKHARIAQVNLERAGIADRVEILVGPALDSLQELDRQGAEAFDLIFIDADKSNNANYLGWALKFCRPGSLIIVDNVVRDGRVVDAADPDPDIQGSRRLFEAIAANPGLMATALQTVGSKGYDGFAIALVTGDGKA